MRSKWFLLLPLALLLPACGTFEQTHYVKSEDATGKPVNYFKVEITGRSGLTRSRYVSGFYDERAVDLFFNELKSAASGDIPPLFPPDQKEPGGETKLTPLSPNEHGALLMVFSTNAKAVTDIIGEFAESQVVADSITNLLNRKDIREIRASAATATTESNRAKAYAAEIDAQMTKLDASSATAAEALLTDMLQTIAQSLGGRGNFKDADEAAVWFDVVRGQK